MNRTRPTPQPALIIDFGRLDYRDCWDLQHRVHRLRREHRLPDCLLLGEHPHVFTIGKRGRRENVLVAEALLNQRRISCLTIERGGDVTYHGPGQLVVYPIFALRGRGMGVVDFVERLEESMIRILDDWGIRGERNPKNRGVWLADAKIGFVGIAVRRGISYHGMALNVDPDLSFFDMINPCGFTDVKTTSMAAAARRPVSMARVKQRAAAHFAAVFDRCFTPRELDDLFDGKGQEPSFEASPRQAAGNSFHAAPSGGRHGGAGK